MSYAKIPLKVGDTAIELRLSEGMLHSLGAVTVNGIALRNPEARFLPWFDSYGGEVFDRFDFIGIGTQGDEVIVSLRAISNLNYPFREQRDSSGDLCFRNLSFDAAPVTSEVAFHCKPASAVLQGRNFTGFTYWFEYKNSNCPIHRWLDRATWEVGGNLDDVTIICRNWLTPPRMRIARNTIYSTVGLEKWATLLPGNMWARWSLLPGFDMQYGQAGILVGWFDRVSLIRTAIESNAGENAIRYNDFHWFEQAGHASTNPKTILHCAERLDDTDALNLWTALQDRDRDMARRQFGIPEEEPPRLTLSKNVWYNFNFDTTYEDILEIGAEFGMDQVFVDVCWEHGQALKEELDAILPPAAQKGTIFEKYQHRNMCCVLDFKVARIHGGEDGLRRLCQRAAAKGLKVISWMATHIHPHSIMVDGRKDAAAEVSSLPMAAKFAHGKSGAVAAMESGRHPWTGYPNSCWTLNLNSPVYDYFRECILGVCERTGLAGYLWDSVSNLGWWQVDYSDGSMRPQFDKMAALYAEMVRRGLYVQPEAICAFSSHSCCGMHGGDIYAGELLGYSYDTAINLWNSAYTDTAILRGEAPVEMLFRCLAHRRAPPFSLHEVPRVQWDAKSTAGIKDCCAMYRAARNIMMRRTVLKHDLGVVWEGRGGERLIWSFQQQRWKENRAVDLLTGETANNGQLIAGRVYRLF